MAVLIKDNVEAGDKVYERFLKRNEKATGISTGYGCLLSFVLSPDFNTETFLDTLRVNKGPSLGTNFTLVCPYTMLAHYSELEWAASCGVSSKLIRVSVGLEPIEVIVACDNFLR